ncbi:RNA-binding protein S1 [Megasphaera cerevisiae DSM 20462]|jgi:ribonuclease G|uniref:RNA-binding protein S1 n=1 Tax=Megasphaera cerevisiae DSM 20462 TaxID=1122219 RepID=A0A0J6WYY2_9FIRM|nr:Rne/Rng family ribonuclease [Megasphaera cerevisiae]KMO87864.1 RNA-binding protein S1 [Megasphaera cerevisiae DSM 20462]MCI1750132.1 Rne/Rng family ribonuclease [Megasphaera cerevisiae]OKY54348.1 RNA-binding protein [Megasphaera cerevisiae]SJZ42220.1 ribonuclease G [Megasphaera cerevisiae DSM 20462]
MKTIIGNIIPEETRIAVIEDGRLRDFAVERNDETHIVNHIYKGVIQNILPALQAAFVNIGRKKNAFLYMGDIFPRAATKEEIQQAHISVGQSILVQVVKEEQSTKGSKVTANVSLAGRYTVLMPTVDYVGVSKKIRSEEERNRLRSIAASVKPDGMGLIIRTVAKDINQKELIADIQYLLRTWDSIQQRYKLAKKPKLLYREADLVMRMVRDHFTSEIQKVIVDDKDAYDRICQVFTNSCWKERVVFYAEEQPIFEYYQIENNLHHLMSRQVSLPSGGNLIFDHAEALTVIDVNSSKYTGNSTLQDTIFHVNKEAAVEIARQLRLRDIGGIILIDFIDMAQPTKRDEILKILEREISSDCTKTRVLGMTALNLVEITRKKSRQSLHQVQFSPCDVCGGSGYLYSPETVAIQIIRRLRHMVRARNIKGDLLISAHADVLEILQEKKQLEALERELARTLHFENTQHPNREVFSILSYSES